MKRMRKTSSIFVVYFQVVAVLAVSPFKDGGRQYVEVSACYGTYRNFLELLCPKSGRISEITRILFAAKTRDQQCPGVADSNNYKEDCCRVDVRDCTIPLSKNTTFFYRHCIGKRYCQLQTWWTPVSADCDRVTYPSYTNFMIMGYYCHGNHSLHSVSERKPNTTRSASVFTSGVHTYGGKTTIDSTFGQAQVTIHKQTPHLTHNTFSPSVIVGIAAGAGGMLLSVLGLLLYCRRKNTASNSLNSHYVSPHFWNYLIPHSLMPKSVLKGYNNIKIGQRTGHHCIVRTVSLDSNETQDSRVSYGDNTSFRVIVNDLSHV